MKDETTRMLGIEMKKADLLITSAQQELDGAKSNNAPQSTIKHLEQRVKALTGRKIKLEKAISEYGEHSDNGVQSATKKNTATSGGKKAGKKAGD